MKKLILIQLILLQTIFLFGQDSLQLFTIEGDQIVNGQTIEVLVTDLNAYETVSEEYFVRNNSVSDIEVMLRQEAVVLVDSAKFSFCALGNCFPPNINETSRPYTISAETTVGEGGVMTGHYHPLNNKGTSLIRYTFYNANDINDTTSFMISFNGGSGTGVNNFDENAVLHAFPNPATSSLFIQYDLENISGTYLKIYNSIGEIVIQKEVNSISGIIKLDVSSLTKGIYIYRLESSNQQTKAHKVIVK